MVPWFKGSVNKKGSLRPQRLPNDYGELFGGDVSSSALGGLRARLNPVACFSHSTSFRTSLRLTFWWGGLHPSRLLRWLADDPLRGGQFFGPILLNCRMLVPENAAAHSMGLLCPKGKIQLQL